MGLFNRFKKTKINNEIVESVIQTETVQMEVEKEVIRPRKLQTQAERLQYIKESCETVIESDRQIDESKQEYQAVTSYLQDMQLIDQIPMEGRETLEDAARKIYNLTKERNRLRQKDTTITDQQYRHFERYEIQIPKELPSIKDAEKFKDMIEADIKNLEKEKKNLINQEKDIISKQSFLKGIAITTGVIIILLFGIFALLGTYSEADLALPFLLTILMGMACALYIFMEARKNISDIQIVQLKQNRQIMLMNKVKIKSVNNRNYLEYIYNKYMVDNYNQLKLWWEEYVKVKDETRRYQQNTEILEFYNQELIDELIEFGIQDAEIWIYQPTAIIDSKEMVEIRHRLNVRRQKLRERIEINTTQKEEAIAGIQSIMKTYPECESEANRMMKQYRISEATL